MPTAVLPGPGIWLSPFSLPCLSQITLSWGPVLDLVIYQACVLALPLEGDGVGVLPLFAFKFSRKALLPSWVLFAVT